MLAAASRRGAAALARSGLQTRFASITQQTRAFHAPRPSPLMHHNVHPRPKHVLSALARASVPFVLQSRGFSAAALPRSAFKAFRVPAGGIAVFTGGFAYINYKVQEVGNWSKAKMDQAGEWIGGTWDAATGVAGGITGGVAAVGTQIKDGFNNTFEGIEGPSFSFLNDFFSASDRSGTGGGRKSAGSPPPPHEPPKNDAAVAAGAAAVAAAGIYSADEEREQIFAQANNEQIMLLTRKMIEIRSTLQALGKNDDFKLPSIVVIGSQSSGKSSVLEGIVGHEFLPKGNNMVTRRPIELTLINTPESAAEYAEFPALKLGKITDFGFVQKTLTDLNLAVPAVECVSDDPIQLNIYSPAIPNLTLIDLPGYIQIHDKDQPETLKERISQLCEKYIRDTNIILAISAADVDLANSAALRAAKKVDPKGLRTIGVITKMDLVNALDGKKILQNNKYPLRLGYIGVVCRAPPATSTAIFARPPTGTQLSQVARHEQSFFAGHPELSSAPGIQVGIPQLKKTLQIVLEKSMSESLDGAARAIRRDLDETSYRFKVEYNDRGLTAETYLAEATDALKAQFANLEKRFSKAQLYDIVKGVLDQRVLDLCAERYWMDERISQMPSAEKEDSYWRRKLEATSGTLARVGVGKIATESVERELQIAVNGLVSQGALRHSSFARARIDESVQEIIQARKGKTIEQVENSVKPYKMSVEIDDREWNTARERIVRGLENELRLCEESYSKLQKGIGGRRKMTQVIQAVKSVHEGGAGGGFSDDLLKVGRTAAFIRDRATLLNLRIRALKSKQCAVKENNYVCPEVFLDAVADKLASMAVLFLQVELVSEFNYQFPRELDSRLMHSLTAEEVNRLAKEDPQIRDHLELMERKSILEYALQKIDDLKSIEATKTSRSEDLRKPRRFF